MPQFTFALSNHFDTLVAHVWEPAACILIVHKDTFDFWFVLRPHNPQTDARESLHTERQRSQYHSSSERTTRTLPSAQTLKPLDRLRPRARSNLRPLLAIRGFLCECGPKPKCFTASRAFFGPRSRRVLAPVGERCQICQNFGSMKLQQLKPTKASSSRVRASPPAATMRARAVRVNRRAAMLSLGSSRRLCNPD